jgi:hypothetical protein
VRGLAAVAGDSSVTLSYEIPTGVDHVVITRSTPGGAEQVVYNGKAPLYIDRGLTNGTEYDYVVASADSDGNRSPGVGIVAVPKRNLLRSPKDGARLKKAPKLLWARHGEADYYNVQLYRGAVKILSAWPIKPTLSLKKNWTFQGRRHSLTPGTYRWFVWPGFGPRANADYGEILGASTFQVLR